MIKRDTPLSQDSLICVSKIQEQVLELIGKDGQEFGTTSGRKDGLYCGRKDEPCPHLQLF